MILALIVLLAAVESTCVPINAEMFWVTFPDGKGEVFLRDGREANVIAGHYPWMGVIRPELRMVNIATQASFPGKSCEYGFVDGRLRFASEGGKERQFDPSSWPQSKGSVLDFWPTRTRYEEQRAKNDIWQGSGRLRFFSRNPNRTALILSQLALIALGILLFSRTAAWKTHGVAWVAILMTLLWQTQSRGGMLAVLIGSAVMVYFRFRKSSTLKRIGWLAFGVALVGGACLGVFQKRAGVVSPDMVESRAVIWREVPRMVAAAPFGWGLWQSGPAYNAWFEKPDRHHVIGDLFNDHLSRFVEGGFVWGGLYVFAWCLVLCAGWRWAQRGGSPVYFAVWLAYFVAASFNPMVYWGPSFAVPGVISAVWVVKAVQSRRRMMSARVVCVSLALTAVALAGFGVAAALAPAQDVPLRVSALGRRVVVGTDAPKVWIADDGFVLSGNVNGYPGREIRNFGLRRPNAEAIGIVKRVCDLPDEIDRLVLTGTCGEDFLKMAHSPKARHIVFLTPPFEGDRIPAALRKSSDVHLLTGEFAARLTGDDRRHESWIHVVPGAQVYVPGWLEIVVKDRAEAGSEAS